MGLGRRRISGGRRIGCRHPDQDFLVQKRILFGHAAGRLAADPAIAVADAGDRLEWNAQPPGRPRGAAVLADVVVPVASGRSEEHTSELQSLMRISYAVFCLKKKNKQSPHTNHKSTSTSKTSHYQSSNTHKKTTT